MVANFVKQLLVVPNFCDVIAVHIGLSFSNESGALIQEHVHKLTSTRNENTVGMFVDQAS